MKQTVYIQPETDAALSKLGGANRAENLRRAVALAECADELAEASIALINAEYDETGSLMESLNHAVYQYEAAKAGKAKQCKACGDFGSACDVCGNKGDSQ